MSAQEHIVLIEELENQLALLGEKPEGEKRNERIDLLTMLARKLWNIDAPRGMAYGKEAQTLSEKSPPYEKGLAESLYGQAIANMQFAHYAEALALANKALPIYQKLGLTKEESDVFLIMGSAYRSMGIYPEALEYLLKSLAIRQNLGIKRLIAGTLDAIGITHQANRSLEKALEACEKAVALYKEDKHEISEVYTLNNLAVIYQAAENFSKALENGQASLQLARRLGVGTIESIALCTLGEIYLQMGEYHLALPYFQQSIEKGEAVHNKFAVLYGYFNLGLLCLAEGRYTQAIPPLKKALELAQATDSKAEIAKVHYQLAQAHKAQENFAQAFEAFEQFYLVEKEIFNTEKDTRFRNLQILYETENAKKEAEIYRLQNEVLAKEITQRKEMEVALQHAANHDPLTKLPNRTFFFVRLDQALSRAKEDGRMLAVIFIDLDRFKEINDDYGHEAGDKVLVNFSERLSKLVRRDDMIARLAGDEFTVLIENIFSRSDLDLIVKKIATLSARICDIGENAIALAFSMGISLYPENGTSAETLLSQADQAMYRAKKEGTVYTFATVKKIGDKPDISG